METNINRIGWRCTKEPKKSEVLVENDTDLHVYLEMLVLTTINIIIIGTVSEKIALRNIIISVGQFSRKLSQML